MRKKHYIVAILIILPIILSVYYVFFRNNEIEKHLDRSRYLFNQRIRNIDLDRFPLRLQIEFERLISNFNNIQLQKIWTTELDFDITHPPFFDVRNIYLVSFDKIAVYNKNDMSAVWVKQFDYDIKIFSLIDGNNILVVDDQGRAMALNRNTGDINWRFNIDNNIVFQEINTVPHQPYQITYNEDRRLITSILVFPVNNEIRVICSITGELFFKLDLDEYIYFLSAYDPVDNAFYVSYGSMISKIFLEKR